MSSQSSISLSFEFSTPMLNKVILSYLPHINSYFSALINELALNESRLKNVQQVFIDLSVVDINEMQSINREHRQKDYPTDVLSFPLQENLRHGLYDLEGDNHLYLGDILICHEVCQKQAKEFNISYEEEFTHLLIHGILHLMGYDHDLSLDEEVLMESLEKKALKHLSQKLKEHKKES